MTLIDSKQNSSGLSKDLDTDKSNLQASSSTFSNTRDDLPFLEHLKELRIRIFYTLIIITLGGVISYSYSGLLFKLLTDPYFKFFPKNSLIGTGPAEAFILKIKTAFFSGLVITLPFTLYQLWAFIKPGLNDSEKKLAIPFIFFSTTLFLGGIYLCYELILPYTLGFFKEQYASIDITPQIKISEHLSLMMFALISFGVMFELPILAYILAKIGLISSKLLVSIWRYAIIVIFILSAILTPTPDAVTMILFAMPLIVLYGISIVIVKLVEN